MKRKRIVRTAEMTIETDEQTVLRAARSEEKPHPSAPEGQAARKDADERPVPLRKR